MRRDAGQKRRGQAAPAGASLLEWKERARNIAAADRAEAKRAAYEERAAIMEFDAHKPRAVAERWARACIRRVPGAV